ncbi:uncharacterized protein LOC134252000, partial [Saccostrea cucullata]|uniref:uncharacterized protein LOC134252000 n=1 Tax=Saccostrea cuccullata TaxID=36930 RepID=UPI002ED3AB5C
MDPSTSAQNVTRCDLCETAVVQMYCDLCEVNLCIRCVGKHISDDYDKHKVVPFQIRKSTLIYSKCTAHETKRCKFQCKECNKFVCSLCTISDKHKGHNISNLLDTFHSKREVIEKDTKELINVISPTYEEIATDIETQIANLDGEYGKLSTAVTKHGEEWHREIDKIVIKSKTEIEVIKSHHISILKKHLDEIKEIQSLIKQTLFQLNRIVESNEVFMTLQYSSKLKELKRLPFKVKVFLPIFSPKLKNTEYLHTLFGFLTPLSNKTEENGYKLKKPETPTRKLLEEPEIITTINTGYGNLCSVTCLSEEEIWTSGYEVSDIKCFNIQGSLIKSIKTKSGEWPRDVAVTGDGDLVYSDWETMTVNKVKNGQTEEMIRLLKWRPFKLCVITSGDLLVTMYSDDKIQSKVVRYTGSIEKQTIQFDEE